jgi:myo-inositol-1(or 4)-monophosphatase
LPDVEAPVAITREQDAALLCDAVREAGALALSFFRTDLRNWTKGHSSPVSEADIAVDELLRGRLMAERPDYGMLSEESADDRSRLTRERVWIIDPIDGTRAFLAHRDDWSISAALVENGLPVAAAVFAPVTQEFFFARDDAPTTLNQAGIAASPGDDLRFERLAGPKPLIQKLWEPLGRRDIHPRIGSLALRLCRVAQGELDAAFAGGECKDWDIVAADLIVRQAGGTVSMLTGDRIVYNLADVRHGLLVAAGRDRHARLIAHFREYPPF